MITLRLGVQTLARTRWSASPAMEAMAWLALAAKTRRHAVFGDPGPAARGALRHPDVSLVADLLSPEGTGYIPDLLTPKPRLGSWQEIMDAQLAEIESAAQDAVDTQVLSTTESHRGRPVPDRIRRLAEAGRLQQRLAAGVAHFWRETLHDDWPALQAVIDTEIGTRSTAIAGNGIGKVLSRLHPRLDWTGDSLIIDTPHDRVVDLTDHDLVLAATVLTWPTLMFQVDDALPATIYYPPSRVGNRRRRGPVALTEVVGAVRAALLTDLAVARSTAELATRHGVAASTVSYHLGALHRARLVSRHRDGRHVLYQRTTRGTTLADTAGS
ncbi:ArsR/SmtB family transcription factor [Micromonospora psammae]|uniref:ArsR/SmtB family transcription factor n=1 Tax=Micromonospora sp. CPCC 205556 TaxID=3122398 RepID=UPI002FF3CC9D